MLALSGSTPNHQFGFRKHLTIERTHGIIKGINNDMEVNKYRMAVFLDVSQIFDKVWHEGLKTDHLTSLRHKILFITQNF